MRLRYIFCFLGLILSLCACSSEPKEISEEYRLIENEEEEVDKGSISVNEINLVQSAEISSDNAKLIAEKLAYSGCKNISSISVKSDYDNSMFINIIDSEENKFTVITSNEGVLRYIQNHLGNICYMSSTVTTNRDKLIKDLSISDNMAKEVVLDLTYVGCDLISSISGSGKEFSISDVNKSNFNVVLSSGGYVSSIKSSDGTILLQRIE